MEKAPTRVLHAVVKGMLPKNALGRQMIKKLKLYAGPEHPHQAQQPRKLALDESTASKTTPTGTSGSGKQS